jgi:chitodextrinase
MRNLFMILKMNYLNLDVKVSQTEDSFQSPYTRYLLNNFLILPDFSQSDVIGSYIKINTEDYNYLRELGFISVSINLQDENQLVIPNSPINVVATAGNASAIVSWSPPLFSDPISSYTVVSNPGNISFTLSGTTQNFTSLTNGTTYNFTVFASNPAGNSATAISNDVIPFTIPGPPINVVATAGNALADVSWSPPVQPNLISSYTVVSNPGSISFTLTGTNQTFMGLTNGTTYNFSVFASNPAGNSATAISNDVIPFTIPGPPINVVASAADSSANVNWSPPVQPNLISSYTVVSNPGSISFTLTGTNQTFTGLTNGTTYNFSVFASNPAGNSTTAISNDVIPATAPSSPLNVIASNGALSGSANLTWNVPITDGGQPIIYYTVTSFPGSITAISSTTSLIFTELTGGETYTFNVYATNIIGNSDPSSNSNPVTISNLPQASVWFDPSNISKVELNGTGVSGLIDLTVNGYNGTYISPFQPGLSYVRPEYNVNPIGGLATFRIDNSGSDVNCIIVPGYNFNDEYISYAMVVRYISGVSGMIATDTPGLFGRGFGCDNGTLQTISYNAFTTWSATASPSVTIDVNTPVVLIASISAGNWRFAINGQKYTLPLTQAKSPDNTRGLNIGCWNPINALSIIFDCGEVLAYTDFLNDSQIDAVTNYLATKWGIAI